MRVLTASNSERFVFFFFQEEDGIGDLTVTGVQTCALPIYLLFFAFLGYLHTLHSETAPAASPTHSHKKKGRQEEELGMGDLAVAVFIVVALTAGAVYLLNVRNIKANIALIDAIRPESILVDGVNGQKEIALENVLKLRLF